MDVQASIEQVAGILCREGVDFDTHENGRSYRIRFGKDAVFLFFGPWQDGVRIEVTSPVLQRIDSEGAGGAAALARLNDLNHGYRFVKWRFDDGTLLAVHDLLGEGLHRKQLLNAIFSLASAAASVAEELAEETGGLRYSEAYDLESDSEIELEGD